MTFYFFVAGCALLLLNCGSNTDSTGPGTNPNTETLSDTVIIDTNFTTDTLKENGIITSIANYRTIIKDSIHNEQRISDTSKVKHGLETKYNNGSISHTINYQNGQRHGITTSYRADGTIDSLQCYQEGVLQADSLLDGLLPTCRGFATGTGTDTIRDLRDSIHLIYGYKDGQQHGLYTQYDTSGTIDYTINYQNGQRHGVTTSYGTDGSIDSLQCYQEGVLQADSLLDSLLPTCRGFATGTGTDTIRGLNDSIDLIYDYQNGQRHGLYTSYNSNGSIKITNLPQTASLYTSYNSNGSIKSLFCYQNGVQTDSLLPTCRGFATGTGTDTIRDLNDSIYRIYGYKEGQQHGVTTSYGTDRTINSLVCYQNGVQQQIVY